MCTAITYRGNDLLYGFNLDIDPAVWQFSVRKTPKVFAVGITVGKTTYLVHGVGSDGRFGVVPYSNSERVPVPRGLRRERIDLMSDRYLRGKYAYTDLEQIVRTKAVVSIPAAPMHALFGSGRGDLLLVEPGLGYRRVEEPFTVLTNFPVLTALSDYSNPFYGKDRYDRAVSVLSRADADFGAEDALRLLYETRQEGTWATRVSFVYSRNQNAVYSFPNGDPSQTEIHRFAAD